MSKYKQKKAGSKKSIVINNDFSSLTNCNDKQSKKNENTDLSLQQLLLKYIPNKNDAQIKEYFSENNLPKIKGMIKKDVEYKLNFNSSHSYYFCWCCAGNSKDGIIFTLKNIDIINKTLIFDINMYTEFNDTSLPYFGDSNSWYKKTCTLIIDYSNKLCDITNIIIEKDDDDNYLELNELTTQFLDKIKLLIESGFTE